MEAASLCLMISATLSIHPDRSHLFLYESFTVSCAVPGSFDGWTFRRNTAKEVGVSCEKEWGYLRGPSCTNPSATPTDDGQYWCESERGECSNVINVTVTTLDVILEIPALPVTEGDRVTLRCSYKEKYKTKSSSRFNATFYKDGVFIGSGFEGTKTLPAVSMSDGGLYSCGHPTEGASLQSPLAVKVRASSPPLSPSSPPPLSPSPPPPLMSPTRLAVTILLFLLYTVVLILCIYTYCSWARVRAEARKK